MKFMSRTIDDINQLNGKGDGLSVFGFFSADKPFA